MQHHLIDLRFKDGVYERAEGVETFSYAENGYLAPKIVGVFGKQINDVTKFMEQ